MTDNEKELLALCDSLIRIAPDSAPGIVATELKRRLTEPSEREKALLEAVRLQNNMWHSPLVTQALAAYEKEEGK